MAVSHKRPGPKTSSADLGSSAHGEETPAGSPLVHSAQGLQRIIKQRIKLSKITVHLICQRERDIDRRTVAI